MNEFTIVTTIGRPVEEVFAVIRDVSRTPVWTPGLTEGRRLAKDRSSQAPRSSTAGRSSGGATRHPRSVPPSREQAVRDQEHRRAVLHRDRHHDGTGGGGYPGDQLLPGREPRLLQVGRAARGPADQEALRGRRGQPTRAPGRSRALTGPFLVADSDRSGTLAGTRGQQPPGHARNASQTEKGRTRARNGPSAHGYCRKRHRFQPRRVGVMHRMSGCRARLDVRSG